MLISPTTFDNVFNLVTDNLSRLEIKEIHSRNNCLIQDKTSASTYYKAFLLDENTKTKIICEITFYQSSKTLKYLPRLAFKKVDNNGNQKSVDGNKDIIIAFSKSEQALVLWKLIGFLSSFKDIVDTGEFENSFAVYSKNKFIAEFETQTEKQKVEDLKTLIRKSEIKEDDIRSILFEKRKHTIKAFLYLLKNIVVQGKPSIAHYREKYSIPPGDEAVWHHFLKSNNWILGLNIDIKFIRDFFDEQKVGMEDSKGAGSPKSDLLGVSDYTTLIELKHANTKIFKKDKNKSRANTWDFSTDFIEGISQCLGQKFSLDKSYRTKDFVNDEGKLLDKNKTLTNDPKTVFIVGNRKIEFPHNMESENYIRSQTFELFRRNNRNIDIITFDELFERAYHTVFGEIISPDWYMDEHFTVTE
jgi:antiviral defense system Shedu protein SduA